MNAPDHSRSWLISTISETLEPVRSIGAALRTASPELVEQAEQAEQVEQVELVEQVEQVELAEQAEQVEQVELVEQ